MGTAKVANIEISTSALFMIASDRCGASGSERTAMLFRFSDALCR
jgi:hypothetical protein